MTEHGCNYCPYGDECRKSTLMGCADLCRDTLELLKEQPKPKAAHWAKMAGMMPPEFTGHFECDNCGWHGKMSEHEKDFDFCPGCGAKMSIGFLGFDGDDCKSTPLD